MIELNQVILVDSPAVALKNERGVFELVSPLGDVIQVACEPGLDMGTPQCVSFDPKRKRTDHLWEIKKIAELPGEDPTPAS